MSRRKLINCNNACARAYVGCVKQGEHKSVRNERIYEFRLLLAGCL